MCLFDEESPQYQKRRRSDSKFRRGGASRKDKSEIIKQSKHKRESASSGYFLNEPHRIPLPPDSSDESKEYLTFIQKEHLWISKKMRVIRITFKSFISMSDCERKKEQKEKRNRKKKEMNISFESV